MGGWLQFLLEIGTTVLAPKHLDSDSGAGAYYATLAKSPFPLSAPVFPSLGNGTLDGWIFTFLSALMLVSAMSQSRHSKLCLTDSSQHDR